MCVRCFLARGVLAQCGFQEDNRAVSVFQEVMDDCEMDFADMLACEEPQDDGPWDDVPDCEHLFCDEGAGNFSAEEVLPAPPSPGDQLAVKPVTATENEELVLPLSQAVAGELAATTPGFVRDPVVGVGLQSPQAKRRRLREKTAPVSAGRALLPVVAPVPEGGGSLVRELFPQDVNGWWLQKSDADKYDYVYNKLRRTYTIYIHERQREFGPRDSLPPQWPKSWSRLREEEKSLFVQWWASSTYAEKETADIVTWAKEYGFKARVGRKRGPQRVPQVLLTYNGDWGVLQLSSQPADDANWETLLRELQESAKVKDVWQEVSHSLAEVGKKIKAEDVAVSLELCLQTLANGGGVRLHAHACFRTTASLQFQTLEDLRAMGCKPHLSMTGISGTLRRRASDWQPFYYIVCPKKGVVFSVRSKAPYRDFAVNAEWIWTLLQSEKITISDARAEFVKCCKNLNRHMSNLDTYERELAAVALKDKIRAKEEHFGAARRPFRRIAAVQRFLALHRKPAERRPFLVVEGPSQMGKTQFVCALVGPGRALEVNCSECVDPPLRRFDMRAHSLILFDEGGVQMVLKNRRLFQAPNCPVTIGSSPTNRDAYDVYLNDTMLVICSNNWAAQLAGTASSDAEWIKKNQIYVSVTEPLWLDH